MKRRVRGDGIKSAAKKATALYFTCVYFPLIIIHPEGLCSEFRAEECIMQRNISSGARKAQGKIFIFYLFLFSLLFRIIYRVPALFRQARKEVRHIVSISTRKMKKKSSWGAHTQVMRGVISQEDKCLLCAPPD